MKRSRAYRLKQKERIRNKARKVIKHQFVGIDQMTQEEFEEMIRRWEDNITQCSCPMCCNPRRYGNSKKAKLTIQERKALEEEEIIGRD